MATVLLVVDVQQMLVDALLPERRAAFVDTLDALLERARRGRTPVVYVRHDGGPTELTPGTPGWEIAGTIAPLPSEAIVDKRFSDAFRDTNLADVLAGLDADHVIVSGMQTEYCIDATIREAERRGFRVTLVADGHATFPTESESEEQIRNHVHRIARSRDAQIVPAAELFTGADATSPSQ